MASSRAIASSCSRGCTERTATCCACTRATTNPLQGVFNTRSSDRPNPIGLHEVEVLSIEGARVHVRPLEAVDGTPIVDVKPVLR
jgi:tRNA (Thr-GGU) A37 N-methylase